MNRRFPVVYNIGLQKVGVLEKVLKVSYSQVYNGLSRATMELAADDPKNNLCRPLWYVELFDTHRIGLFRIMPKTSKRDGSGAVLRYELEHVLSTLMDSTLYKYHEIGNLGVYTADVMQYILSFQNTAHWQFGGTDFTRQFQYSWENENLLAALFSIPKPFDTEFRWEFNTLSYPWSLSLRNADNSAGPEIRYRANLREVESIEDPTNLCTRLYALGQGEGVNQLTFADANPSGLEYIDSDTQGAYGVISRIWVDKRYESAETLFGAASAMLEKLKVPLVTFRVSANDLYKLTMESIHEFRIGRNIRVLDEDLGIDYSSRVIKIEKGDIYGDPGNIQLEIANQPKDVAGTIADLASRTRINEVYSQGATSLDTHQNEENADGSNPVRVKFHIPSDAVYINKVLLNYQTSAFRSYSTGAATGGSTTQTSSGGGDSTTTSSSGGASSPTSSSGGGQTSSTNGGHSHTVSGQTASSSGAHIHSGTVGGRTGTNRYLTSTTHNHDVSISFATSTNGSHTHPVSGTTSSTISNHTHTVSNHTHSVSVPSHTHSVSVPSHTHSVSIPSHSHTLVHGIYSGPTPTAVTVRVDGTIVPSLGTNETEVSIVPYLSKDSDGKITRGWHEVTVTPNTLGRVNVAVHIQQFVQSRGDIRV